MADPRLAIHADDHATGLELQLNELNGQLERARAQGRSADEARLQQQIGELVDELAQTAEAIANPHWDRPVFHGDVHHAA
ncbi:MAG: hypothetical protein JF603_04845 [Acidobacteria bacterium]|nr:hypothetical protein [Acidobacteriota bacterium]